MKNLQKVYILFLCFLLSQVAFSQDILTRLKEEHPNATLREIMQIADRYFADKEKGQEKKHHEIKDKTEEKESAEEGEYFQYKRWEYEQLLRFGLDEIPTDYAAHNFKEFHRYLKQQQHPNAKVTTNYNGNWRLFGPSSYNATRNVIPGIGRVTTIVADPTNHNILYLGTPNTGLWRSTDKGDTWTGLNDGMSQIGVSGIIIDRNSPVGNRTIYILTGDGDNGGISNGVLVSYNNGASWYSAAIINTNYARKLKQNPYNNNLLIASSSGIIISTNNGTSWTNVLTGNFSDVEFHPTNSQVIYASTMDGKFYKSLNAGSAWIQITTGFPTNGAYHRIEIAVTPNMPNRVYLLNGNGNLARSDDNGLTFTITSAPDLSNVFADQTYYNLAIACSPVNGDIVHIGGLYSSKSTDGGASFTGTYNTYDYFQTGLLHSLHSDIHELVYIGADTVYAGCDGGIYHYVDNLNGWIPHNNGLPITQFYKIGGNPNNAQLMLGGAQDNGLGFIEQNTITHWDNGDGMETFIDPIDDNIFYGTIQFGQAVVKSINRGLNTIDITPPPLTGEWVTPFCMDPNDNQKLYIGYKDVLKSSNQGANWTNISNGQLGLQTNNYCHVLSVAPSNSNIIYVYKALSSGKLFITENGGTTWTEATNPTPSNTINSIVVHPLDPKNIWVISNSSSKVYHSINGGVSWTNISGTLPNITPMCLIYQKNSTKNRLYLGTDAGIYYLDDDHTDWQLFTNGLPIVQARDFEINYKENLLRVGTYGRGIWETELVCDNDDDLLVSGPVSASQFGGKITATNAYVSSNTSPVFVAKNYVDFKEGFQVSASSASQFHAYLNASPCSVQSPFAVHEPTGTYLGPMPGVLGVLSKASDKADYENRFELFPNPARDITNMDFAIETVSQIEISIRNITGVEVVEKIVASGLSPGKYEYNLNTSNLISGSYIVTLKVNNASFTKTLSIVK
jgi:photosystem II stability/assembly factor-like uncharacterized protein